jgi:hypothetical protein
MTEGRWERFGGKWIFVRRTSESVREMVQRCRAADEERTRNGTQEVFLQLQSVPVERWDAARWKKQR